jgi:hypothetical protein
MKKIVVSVVALMCAVSFTNCNNGNEKDPDNTGTDKPTEVEDKTPPKITLPDSTNLVLDLGDKTNAIKDVKANDDVNGNITTSIKLLTDLDIVGNTQLVYTVADLAGNRDTATRSATIRSRKLSGYYTAKSVNDTDKYEVNPFTTQDFSVVEKQLTTLEVTGLHNLSKVIMFSPVVGSTENKLAASPVMVTYDGMSWTFTGDLIYTKVSEGVYAISFSYQLETADRSYKESWSTTVCTKKTDI